MTKLMQILDQFNPSFPLEFQILSESFSFLMDFYWSYFAEQVAGI